MVKIWKGYLDGEWHGNGIEYESNGDISFEGKFKNGKRWKGFGKEYYSLVRVQYKGEYLNGEKNINGIEFSPDGNIIFPWEYLHNKRWNGNVNEKTYMKL